MSGYDAAFNSQNVAGLYRRCIGYLVLFVKNCFELTLKYAGVGHLLKNIGLEAGSPKTE